MKTSFRLLAVFAVIWSHLDARDCNPGYWFENVPASDDSVQQCLVFRSIPGAMHTVQVSENLTDWEPYEVIGEAGGVYGLGGEIVVPLREFTPPPIPPSDGGGGTWPPHGWTPPVNVSLVLRSMNGGGTVATWNSLDDAGPVAILLEEDLHEDWQYMPIYWESLGDFRVYIWKPPLASMDRPAGESVLGPTDEALRQILEDNLADMNTKVANAAAVARNSPPPSPPAPGSRKFLRIHSNFDLDTDNDGVPDWAEFEIMGDPQHPSHALADPFEADADGDGVADGRQIDTDKDGIPDALDAANHDPAIDWEKGPVARYALFGIQGVPAPSSAGGQALHVTDGGQVLFPQGIWNGSGYQPLQSGGDIVHNAWASAMSDSGLVVGTAHADFDGNGTGELHAVVYWSSPQATPKVVRDTGAGSFAAPSPRFSGWYDPGNLIGEENTILSPEFWIVPDGTWYRTEWVGNVLWELGDQGIGKSAAPEHATHHFNRNFLWGQAPTAHAEMLWYHDGDETVLDRWYATIARAPGGRFAALGNFGAPYFSSPAPNSTWRKATQISRTVDMSEQGWIALEFGEIWANGFKVPFGQAAPGLPEAWDNLFIDLLDSSPKGNLLVQRTSMGDGSLLGYAVAMPLVLEDTEPATGVDAVSVTSEDPGSQPEHKQWIMAPAGGSNSFKIKSTVSATSEMELTSGSAILSSSTLSDKEMTLSVSAPANAATADIDLGLKLGGEYSLSSPIGIKVMKRRTVRPRVWLVPCLNSNGTATHPVVKPTKQELDSYLNEVFFPQLNASFDCTVTETAPVDYDTADGSAYGAPAAKLTPRNGYLDTSNSGIAEFKTIRDLYYDPNANMNIYIVGGALLIHSSVWLESWQKLVTSSPAVGLTDVESRTCVLVSNVIFGKGLEQLKDTIAHEVGHIILGAGHPDQAKKEVVAGAEEWMHGGKAPLPGTDHTKRLMCSGSARLKNGTSRLIVKGEWDEAEKWFVNEEGANRISQN